MGRVRAEGWVEAEKAEAQRPGRNTDEFSDTLLEDGLVRISGDDSNEG
jgi:hypothetical protein